MINTRNQIWLLIGVALAFYLILLLEELIEVLDKPNIMIFHSDKDGKIIEGNFERISASPIVEKEMKKI